LLSSILLYLAKLGDAIGLFTIAVSILIYIISAHKNDSHFVSIANSIIVSGILLILICGIIYYGASYA